MHTLKISAYPQDHTAVVAALASYVVNLSSSMSLDGFLLVSGEVSDPDGAESAAREAGAHSVRFLQEEGGVVVEPYPAALDATHVATTVATEVATEVEDTLASFVARFPTPEKGIAFTHMVAGLVTFSEPPTGWEDGAWCVRGKTKHPVAVGALAADCGGEV